MTDLGDPPPAPLTETPLSETDAAFSPNGKLVTYTANVLGGLGDVVVQDLDSAERWTVSTRQESYLFGDRMGPSSSGRRIGLRG